MGFLSGATTTIAGHIVIRDTLISPIDSPHFSLPVVFIVPGLNVTASKHDEYRIAQQVNASSNKEDSAPQDRIRLSERERID